jgi:hypothetical protein
MDEITFSHLKTTFYPIHFRLLSMTIVHENIVEFAMS